MKNRSLIIIIFLLAGGMFLLLQQTSSKSTKSSKSTRGEERKREEKNTSIQDDSAKKVVLSVHHFLSPASLTHSKFLLPWTERVEKASQGKIAFNIYPSMALGGKANELFYQVRDGVVDIAWTLIGYTPGLFPRTEVFELPTVHRGDAVSTTLALQKTLPLIQDDFIAVKVLLLHVHSGNSFHFANGFTQTPTKLSDFANLKIRTPSRTGAWMLDLMGANSISMPVPEIPEALTKNIIDGALIPFEIALTLKVPELSHLSIKGVNERRFGTSVFLLAMNLEKYKALPEGLQRIIDNQTGIELAEEVARLWEAAEQRGEQAQRNSGGQILELGEEFFADFDEKMEELNLRWQESLPISKSEAQELFHQAKENVKFFSTQKSESSQAESN